MIISCQDLQQDTIPRKTVSGQDSSLNKTVSASGIIAIPSTDSSRPRIISLNQNVLPDAADTTSICTRNIIADVTYYDFNNFIRRLGYGHTEEFPFVFITRTNQFRMEEHAILLKKLKPGKELPPHPLHTDWMIIILLAAAFLFSVVKSSSRRMLTYFERVFVFKGLNNSSTRDVTGLFHWQSTILNLISFIIIALFGYTVATYYEVIPSGFRGISAWLIAVGIISLAVTIRHTVCIITGSASGQKELFREYLLGIYHSYRFGAVFLFVFIIMMSYTEILPEKDYILSGIIILFIIYLIRVIRLLIIFLNRSVSIFYLILYLCALEILPVLIIVKYFTGLV
jgi:hypothetical protein